MTRIGLLGYGTVGQAFADLVNTQDRIAVDIAGAVVRDLDRPRGGPAIALTQDPRDIVERDDVDVIVDVMGGQDVALEWTIRALRSGKPVISANKEVIAHHGVALQRLAEENGVTLTYEAAVGGGIPLLAPLLSHFGAAPVTRIVGILNGTTNYILSQMEAGDSLNMALAKAQALGYAESDPRGDLDGTDVLRKLALVMASVFGAPANLATIPCRGIDYQTSMVVERITPWGWRLKLLAAGTSLGEAQIWPTLVPADHRLARLDGVTNALGVEVHGQWFWLEGPGAGGPATALSLLADLVRGYDRGFHAGRLARLPVKAMAPLKSRWLAFPSDPDRALGTLSLPHGTEAGLEYAILPAMCAPDVLEWINQNPGLLALPLLEA